MPFSRFDSPAVPTDRWYLASPRLKSGDEVDPRLFTTGRPLDWAAPLFVPLRRRGRPLDFTLADFDMPVVSAALASLLQLKAPDCFQLLPAKVEGDPGQFFVLNATRAVPCISDRHSLILRWTSEDGRPDKVGTYRMVANPVLTPSNHRGEAIFRAAGWEIMLLATETLAQALQASDFTGLKLVALPEATGDA